MNVIITVHANESFPITGFRFEHGASTCLFLFFPTFRQTYNPRDLCVDCFALNEASPRLRPMNTTVSQIESLCLEFLRRIYHVFFTLSSRFKENIFFWIMEIFHLSIDMSNSSNLIRERGRGIIVLINKRNSFSIFKNQIF